MKKYKLLDDHRNAFILSSNVFKNGPIKAYRIQALRSFGNVKEGVIGGYVSSEKNLSHDGNCRIAPNSEALGSVHLTGDTQLNVPQAELDELLLTLTKPNCLFKGDV